MSHVQLKSKQSEVERKEEILAQLHERYSAAKPANPSVRSGKHKAETDATEKPRRLDASRGSLEVKVWQQLLHMIDANGADCMAAGLETLSSSIQHAACCCTTLQDVLLRLL